MKKRIRILKKQLNEIVKDAISCANQDGTEICGLLVDNGNFIELIKTKNKVKKGGGFEFYINEIKYLEKAISRLNHKIIGTFHSHPMFIAKPSDSDIENALDDSLMLIIDVIDKDVGLWHIKNRKLRELKYELK